MSYYDDELDDLLDSAAGDHSEPGALERAEEQLDVDDDCPPTLPGVRAAGAGGSTIPAAAGGRTP